MPIYEYRREDGTTFEVMQPIADPPLKKDPETGQKVQRVLHAPSIHFKGSGFYNTDYGTKRRAREQERSEKSESKPSEGKKEKKAETSSSSSSSSTSSSSSSAKD